MILSGFFIALLVTAAISHQCYKCGPLSQGFQKTCEFFEPNSLDYKETCPQGYKSCSIQYKASMMVRQCENNNKINDCKIANDVKYCYCNSDLCNGINVEYVHGNGIESDDEDMSNEGSGFFNVQTEYESKQNNVTVAVERSRSETLSNNAYLIFISTSFLYL